VAFALVLTVIGAFVVLPQNPTFGQKVLGELAALIATTVIVVGGTFAAALVAAPYQQRNALRRAFTQLCAADQAELAHEKIAQHSDIGIRAPREKRHPSCSRCAG
jgi:hypothetical protein